MTSVRFRFMDCGDWTHNPETDHVEFEAYQLDDQNQEVGQTIKASVSRRYLRDTYGIADDMDLIDAATMYHYELESELASRAMLGELGDIDGMEVTFL